MPILSQSPYLYNFIMDQIPEPLFLDIFSYLSIHEVFQSVSLVNKTFHSITKIDHFLEILVKSNLRLCIPQHLPGPRSLSLLKSCTKPSVSHHLNFRACSTDGGVDEDHEEYYFGYMFEYNDRPYCTQEDAFNTNVSGVLSNTQEEKSGYYWAHKKIIEIVREWLHRKGKKLYQKNEHIAVAIFKQVTTSFPLDAITIDEPNPELLKNTIRSIYNNLKPFSWGIEKTKRFKDNSLVLDLEFDRLGADSSSNFAVFSEIFVSRRGSYTCPVKTLMVFTSFSYVDILDPRLKAYNNMKSHENLVELQEFYKNCAVPERKRTGVGIEYCEFRMTSEELKPVLWIQFLEEGRIDEVCVKLNREVTGKYIYVKLIQPEDRREHRGWLHDNMNIDCKIVMPIGRVISIV